MQRLVRTAQNCAADHGDLTGPVLGLVVDAPVVVQRQVLGCAMLVSTVDIFCVSSRRASWTSSSHFQREGGTLDPQVDSCFFLANMAEEEVAALVFYTAVARILLVLLLILHLALCSRQMPPGRHAHAEKCAQ